MGSPYLRHGRAEGESILGDKIRDFGSPPTANRCSYGGTRTSTRTTVDKAFATKAAGEKVEPVRDALYAWTLQKEWTQIFDDAWRWYRDFFYDPGMHGRDWKAMGDKYRAYIPYLSSREELNWVLSQMVGELCVSHTYIGGGDIGPAAAPGIAGLHRPARRRPGRRQGAGLYRFAKIYGPTEFNLNLTGPLARPDVEVKEGDYLIAINGRQVKAADGLLQAAADHRRTEDHGDGQRQADSGRARRPTTIDPIRNDHAAAVFPLADGQHPIRAEGHRRQGRVHAHQRHGRRRASASSTSSGAHSGTRTGSSSTCAGIRAAGRSTS